MADAESEPMQAGVVNVLLTIDPAASHAAGTYLTWDGAPFDEEETARCDAATPHELWAWTITTDEAPGAAAEPRADVRRLTTIVAGAPGQAPGMLALECAMDELAAKLGMDPIARRTTAFSLE